MSGGVSLGSYEAGYLYYLSLLFKLNPDFVDPRIFTGASAGSANALLALMASCSKPDFRVTENPFFRSWIPVGIQGLFKGERTSPIAALSREPGEATLDLLQQAWNRGLDERCDAVLGISVTRVSAIPVQLTEQVKLPRTGAKFVLRVRGNGPGKAPTLTNYVSPLNEIRRPMLPEGDDGAIEFLSLRQALEASTAFPLAFEPRPVAHCPSSRSDAVSLRCPRAQAITALFYDGGVFDNQPLRLAAQVARRGLDTTGPSFTFRATPDVSRDALPPRAAFLYLDPDTEVLPEFLGDSAPPMDDAVSYGAFLLGQLVGAARSAELQSLLDEAPQVKNQLAATLTYFRPLSGVLLNFFGFFETDVRVHDFYLGMYDAARFAREYLRWPKPGATLVRPEDQVTGMPEFVRETWLPFHCFRAVLDGVGDRASCEGLPPNLLAGLQVTADKLWARCDRVLAQSTRAGLPTPATPHRNCQEALAGAEPPLVPTVPRAEGWRYRAEESDLDYQLRRMQEHRYRFTDLKLGPGESPRRRVAKTLSLISRSMGQPGAGNVLIPSLGRSYAQSLEYVPPDHALTVLVGQALEVGYSGTQGDAPTNWVRFHASLGVEGMLTALGPETQRFISLAPRVGAEFEAVPLSSASLQWRFGVRGGFQFSSADEFSRRACDRALPCSRVVTDAWVAVTAFQWVRAQLAVEVLPPMFGLPLAVGVKPALGLELDWP